MMCGLLAALERSPPHPNPLPPNGAERAGVRGVVPLARSMALARLTLIRLAALATFSRNAGEGARSLSILLSEAR